MWNKRRIWFYFDGMRNWTYYNRWNNPLGYECGFITLRCPLFAVMIFKERVEKYV